MAVVGNRPARDGHPPVCGVQRALDSSVKRTLAAYLYQHPYTYEHCAGLAYRFSLSPEEMAPVITELASTGLLLKMGEGQHALYALNVREGWHEMLERYFNRHPEETDPLATLRCMQLSMPPT